MPYRVASLKTSMRQCQVHHFGHTLCVLCRPSGLFHGHRGQHLTSSTRGQFHVHVSMLGSEGMQLSLADR